MRKFLFIYFLLQAFAVAMAAKVEVIPPPRAVAGEKFAVSIRVTGASNAQAPARPNIAGCTYIFGPSVYESSSTTIINGRRESSSSITYTFTFRADRAGQVTIPAMQVNVDGQKLTTRATSFSIAASAAAAQGTQRNKPTSVDDVTTQTSDRPVNANDVFVRIILNKSTAYEQEAIECVIKLYTKYNIDRFFPTKQPAFDGFLIDEVELSQPLQPQRETYNGANYVTAVLKKCIIFPQKSGTLTINSGEYDISVVQFDQVNMGYFTVTTPGGSRQLHVSSNSASIEIRPLPQPQPADFSGAVGTDFTISSRLIGNEFRTGEAASLVFTITGTGNIKYVKEPSVTFPSEFEVYSPKSNFEGGVSGATVQGTQTIDYTFVPGAVGDYHIPGSKFVYFDLGKGEYVTLSTGDFDIKVAQGTSNKEESISSRMTDILPIISEAKAGSRPAMAIYSLWYWLMIAAMIIGLVAAIAIFRRNRRLAADVTGMRISKANKVARGRLKTAQAYLDKADTEQFYAELLSAVWGYLSDKLTIPASQLSRDNIRECLAEYGAQQELIDRIIDILDRAEMARYTPSTSQQASDLLADTRKVIDDMEAIKSPSHKKQP